MKLFLTSVASCLDSVDSFKELINPQTKLVILPFSYHKNYIHRAEDIYNHFDRNPSNKESIFWHIAKPFIDAGIDPDRICIINQYADNIEYIKYRLLQPNTIVYLPGGFPENIVANVKKYNLLKTLKQCEVIVGESAGSMCIFSEFFVYKDQDYKRYKRFKGLKFMKGITLIPHCTLDNENIKKACKRYHKKRPKTKIFCVIDGGYLFIDNNELIECKKAYIYKNKKNKGDN